MSCSIEAAEIGEIEVEHIARAVGEFIDGVVMKYNEMPIASHLNIKFNSIYGQCEGITKRSQRILRCKPSTTTMSNFLYLMSHNWFISLIKIGVQSCIRPEICLVLSAETSQLSFFTKRQRGCPGVHTWGGSAALPWVYP